MIMRNSTTAGTVPKSRDNTTIHNKTATAATIMRNSTTAGKVARQHNNTQQTGNGRNDYAESTNTAQSHATTTQQHTTNRQRPQRLCGISTTAGKVARQHNDTQQAGNGRNDYAESTNTAQPKVTRRDNTTTHNKPATAATIMRNFHHCWQSRATTQQHTTNRQRPQRLCGISTTAGKVARQHNTQQTGNGRNDYAESTNSPTQSHATRQHNSTQQTGNGRNNYAEFPSLLAKLRDNTTTHNRPATAATIMRNFHPPHHSPNQSHATMTQQHTTKWQRQRPQRLCGIFAR